MTIQVYAILKDYFDKVSVVEETVDTIASLRQLLIARNPVAAGALAGCRFAINDHFVDDSFQLHPHDSIHIIPPSSGG